MFRRLSAWHILTAGLIGLSPACSSGREDATSHRKIHADQAMPPLAEAGPDLTSVKPAAASAPAPVAEAEPAGKEVASPQAVDEDEVLDRMVFEAERKPADVELRVKVARALLDAGKVGEARVHAERAIEADQKSAAAWHTLGRIEMAEHDHEAAAASFQRSVEEAPEDSHAWNNLGYVLIELKNFEEAAAALEHATSGTSPAPYMWNNLGMAYEHLDRIREARAAYRQAAEGGSTKGQANLERLEGVSSLRPAEPTGDGAEAGKGEKVEGETGAAGGSSAGGGSSQVPEDEDLGC